MDAFVIQGGKRLSGRITINGSKNAALPLLAVSLMTDEPVTLRNVPRLADINNMRRLLAELGVTETETEEGGLRNLTLRTADESNSHARYDIVRTMRASICVLGPMLAKRGYARVSMPGGCAIGDRPVDLHLRGMEALGAEVTLDAGDIIVRAPATGRLRGARIFLGGPFGPTVLGTSNVMCAAALAEGTTIIESAACEPECVDVARLLNAMGAKITGAGTPRIIIEGVEALHGADHNVMPDRIEAGTYMMAAAITGGRLVLDNCPIDCLLAAVDRLEHMGVHVKTLTENTKGTPGAGPGTRNPKADSDAQRYHASVEITRDRIMRPVQVTTQPHPGFPTDLQAQLMALLCLAQGNSVVTETIYPQRFLHVAELSRMGAQLFRQGPTVIVSGVPELVGAPVMASDLRASASLVLAGLAAKGTTTVLRVYHLDRGYEKMEERLRALGADIERIDERELAGLPVGAGEA